MAASMTIAHGHGCTNLPVRVPHLMPFHIHRSLPTFASDLTPEPCAHCTRYPSHLFHLEIVKRSSSTATANAKVVLFEEKENVSAAVDAERVEAGPAIKATAEVDVVVANVKAPASPVRQSGPIHRLSESAKRFI